MIVGKYTIKAGSTVVESYEVDCDVDEAFRNCIHPYRFLHDAARRRVLQLQQQGKEVDCIAIDRYAINGECLGDNDYNGPQ